MSSTLDKLKSITENLSKKWTYENRKNGESFIK